MGLTKYVLVVLAGVAISGLVVWQLPTVAPNPSPVAAVATGNAAAPVAPVAIDKVKKDVAPAVSADAPKVVKKQPAPAVRHEPPADVKRALVPDVSREPIPDVRHEVEVVSRAVAEPVSTAPADRSFETLSAVVDRGGKVTFMLMHDHTSGNFDSRDPKATCVGELTIMGNEVRFESTGPDRFAARWTDVRETGANKFFGSGIGGFHVTINTGGKYQNFNLAPQSKDKGEGKLILDLLRAHARKQERSK